MTEQKSPQPDTSQRGEDTRRRLIDAGIEIFGIYGYEAASTRSLAEKAGVNLAAIPYYFGGKEGLYRAVAEHVAGDIEQSMAAITQKISVALKQPQLSREDTLVLLQELIDTFAMGIIASEPDDHSTRFIMREQLDPTSAFDVIYENVMLKVLRPCEALISRLLEKPEDDPECIIRAFTVLGQVLIFRLARTAALRSLKWDQFTDERVKLIRAVVQQHFDSSVYRSDE